MYATKLIVANIIKGGSKPYEKRYGNEIIVIANAHNLIKLFINLLSIGYTLLTLIKE